MLMDEKTKQIILSQAINLAQKEVMHLNNALIDRNKIKEVAKQYYKLIIDLNKETFGTEEKVEEPKKELKIDL